MCVKDHNTSRSWVLVRGFGGSQRRGKVESGGKQEFSTSDVMGAGRVLARVFLCLGDGFLQRWSGSEQCLRRSSG